MEEKKRNAGEPLGEEKKKLLLREGEKGKARLVTERSATEGGEFPGKKEVYQGSP